MLDVHGLLAHQRLHASHLLIERMVARERRDLA